MEDQGEERIEGRTDGIFIYIIHFSILNYTIFYSIILNYIHCTVLWGKGPRREAHRGPEVLCMV